MNILSGLCCFIYAAVVFIILPYKLFSGGEDDE